MIFKARAPLDVAAMLQTLQIREDEVDVDLSIERATSSQYDGVALYTKESTAWLFGCSSFSCNCSFEAELTETERQLASLSRAGDVFLFHINGHSDTYGWALFQAGARTCVRLFLPTDDEPVEYSDGTVPEGFDQPPNETGIFEIFGDFGGMGMFDLYEYARRRFEEEQAG
jgi:hypothetical protein